MKKMFDKVDIVDNMILGKVDNDNVDNDTADELAVEYDGIATILNIYSTHPNCLYFVYLWWIWLYFVEKN